MFDLGYSQFIQDFLANCNDEKIYAKVIIVTLNCRC